MKKIIAFVAFLTPAIALAQTTGGKLNAINNVNDLGVKAADIINTVTYLLVAVAVIFIVWNVVRYLILPSGAEGKAAVGGNILWGIVGLFIIVSIWGLVNILTNTFATNGTKQPIPNSGNIVDFGGQPANQNPAQVR